MVLEAENVTGNGVHNISFKLKKGEILGFAGLVGCGRTELMSVIFGDTSPGKAGFSSRARSGNSKPAAMP